MSDGDGKVLESGERRETVVAWIVIALLVAVMFFRAALSMWLYGNPPRSWQYRVSPQIPAQAYGSTQPASPSTQVEKQVPLPPGEQKEKKE